MPGTADRPVQYWTGLKTCPYVCLNRKHGGKSNLEVIAMRTKSKSVVYLLWIVLLVSTFIIEGVIGSVYAQAPSVVPPEILKDFLPPPLAECRREEEEDFNLAADNITKVSVASIRYVDTTPEGMYGDVRISIEDYGDIHKNIPESSFIESTFSADPSEVERTKIKGYPMVIFREPQEEGEYNISKCLIMVKNRFGISIEVIGVEAWNFGKVFEIMMNYVNAIDYDGIGRLATGKESKPPQIETIKNIKNMKEGDEITSKVVDLGEGSVLKISDNSKVKVAKVSNKEISFKVKVGKVWTKIKKLSKGQSINIYGITAVTCVRGTEFVFEVKKDGTSIVTVIEGMVEFSDLSKKKTVLVKEKQKSTVKLTGIPSSPELVDLKKITRWWEVLSQNEWK